jgi:hypothetical protein
MKRIFLPMAILLLFGCVQKISDIKNDESVGKEVKVKGVVESSIKIGTLSGYRVDDGAEINVKSETLPRDGDEVVVKGVLMKDTLFGYYILEK